MASRKISQAQNPQRKEDPRQAVIVDYKAIGCNHPNGSPNVKPFIQYSLEWLLIEGFDEVFVCCLPENAQEMRDFVAKFLRTEYIPSNMSIKVHVSESNFSTGDCLRDLDPKGAIKADFVIMDAGCCGNLPLAELLEQHKKLRKTDKNAILTSVVRNLFTKNPANIGEFPVHIIDPKTGMLLHYAAGLASSEDNTPSTNISPAKFIQVPPNIFLERESAKIHTNLCSTNLSIYSANVPALYTELFDCHSESDLIQAAFDNHEVLGSNIYVHVVDDLFSQRMADFGFVINQNRDKFDANLIYKRNHRCQVLRKLVNDSLIDCTRCNVKEYLANMRDDEESEDESESESEQSLLDDDELFLSEVMDSLVRGFEETIENENLVLEVNSSKHAYNINIDDVYSTIARALLLLPEKLNIGRPTSVVEYSSVVEKSISKFTNFLLNYMKSDDSREAVVATMEVMYLTKEVSFLTEVVLAKIFYKLYEVDALDEESLLNWFKDYDDEDESKKKLRASSAITQLIKALEAESGDDDDDDESESE